MYIFRYLYVFISGIFLKTSHHIHNIYHFELYVDITTNDFITRNFYNRIIIPNGNIDLSLTTYPSKRSHATQTPSLSLKFI